MYQLNQSRRLFFNQSSVKRSTDCFAPQTTIHIEKS